MTGGSPPVRIGVIGCGNVLSAYRTPLEKLRMRGLAEVIVACGRAHQGESASAHLGTNRFTTTPEEVLSSNEVDVVMILTSMREHAQLARAALEAGKHVFVEKPMATSLEDGKQLVE